MLPQPASILVPGGLAGLTLLVAAGWVWICAQTDASGRRTRALGAAALLAVWMTVAWTLAHVGVLARFDATPPPFLVLVALSVAAAASVGFSSLGSRLAAGTSLAVLVGFQAFRLPLELVMHRAAVEGVMPLQMSWSGRNFDVATGIGAAIVGLWLALGRPPRAVVWLWNLAGLALLVNVVGVAVASLPRFHAFGTDPAALNTWVAYPPYVWLPTILVPSALLGHILVTRRLLQQTAQ